MLIIQKILTLIKPTKKLAEHIKSRKMNGDPSTDLSDMVHLSGNTSNEKHNFVHTKMSLIDDIELI